VTDKNYQITGKGLQNVQLVMAKANYGLPSYEAMYKILADNYINNYVSFKDSELITEAYKYGSDRNLFCVSMLGHYIKTKINVIQNNDEVKLMRFFPNNQFIYNFLQMTESKWVAKMRAFTYTSVKTNVKLSIKVGGIDSFLEASDNYGFRWRTLNSNFSFESLKASDFLFQNLLGDHKDAEFKIRIISNINLSLKKLFHGNYSLTLKEKERLKKVIFHVHGGGFISMSSSSHQSYLRKFCKSVDTLIFSIDYPLAPMSKYKQIIEIIFKSYIYIQVN